jgi:hypothetical protein
MSVAKPAEVHAETADDLPNSTIDLDGEFDAAIILLELRNAFVLFRDEVRRDLRSIRADTDFTRKYMKNMGLRLTALEQDKDQIAEEVRAIATATPPPVPYPPDEVLR